jgi:hypothetical protein
MSLQKKLIIIISSSKSSYEILCLCRRSLFLSYHHQNHHLRYYIFPEEAYLQKLHYLRKETIFLKFLSLTIHQLHYSTGLFLFLLLFCPTTTIHPVCVLPLVAENVKYVLENWWIGRGGEMRQVIWRVQSASKYFLVIANVK